jgi:hypothetical protein
MANSNFTQLTSRNKSSLVTAIHKEITYYSSSFCIRERVYVNKLTKDDDNIYWLQAENKQLAAFAIMDPNYEFEVEGIKLHTIGHTISKRPGYMERILTHIFKRHPEKSLILLCKEFVAKSLDIASYGMKCITPLELEEHWPELASLKTDYFNVKNEPLKNGMIRKQHNLYIKITDKDRDQLDKKLQVIL